MRIAIIGGAGFIGSACANRLLQDPDLSVTVIDNFSSGRRWHLDLGLASGRMRVVAVDAADLHALVDAIRDHELLYHFASNPDIAKAATEPTIDFSQGTLLSQNIFEAARLAQVPRVIYASGSGVFGDNPSRVFVEQDFSPCPTSTYAASKAAGETLLSAYCHMFGLRGISYRFANVVGPHQTHGVAYDFINRLLKEPSRLSVMGNGSQTKSYIHVEDIVSGLTFFGTRFPETYRCFNLTTDNQLTVREIAEMVIAELGLTGIPVDYGTTDKGWPGDVPVIRFSADKIKALGWTPRYDSREAMRQAIRGMIANAKAGRFAR